MGTTRPTAEQIRLDERERGVTDWGEWGPYLSERAWGTVREDYREEGKPWLSFPHDHARSRAYRWNEDGLAGISDRGQYLCFSFALWNTNDPILKERFFGLAGPEGNHGEDVKEVYFYLDNTPTHSYMRMLYKYPHDEFPYELLVAENAGRSRSDPEFDLIDTGVFAAERYFDIEVEYAKAGPRDILIQLTATNRGPDPGELVALPTLWFRNTWSWGYPNGPMGEVSRRPELWAEADAVIAEHPVAGRYVLYAEAADALVFTDNVTNLDRLYGRPNPSPFVKDAFHSLVVDGDPAAVNPGRRGTKAAARYRRTIAPGGTTVVRLRLMASESTEPFAGFTEMLDRRRAEADGFYAALHSPGLDTDERSIQRRALAGLLWNKQLYYYDVAQWQRGDPEGPTSRPRPLRGRNRDWAHLNNFDVISMPDKWEYPWYAAWDLGFHCVALAMVDPGFAKRQLILMTREWYMHPSGQLPAYEWSFGDANPPVHAWAAWEVYQQEARATGRADRDFLEAVFHKLLLNFTWWVNRKDVDGDNVFQGGFLGLDNISVFNRSEVLPAGGHLDQSDGTAWMGFYALGMLRIAIELARDNHVYENLATKFFEHFLAIAAAMSDTASGHCLWDGTDGFFYDVLHTPDGGSRRLGVRSLVGLIPLLAVDVIEAGTLESLPDFAARIRWLLRNRPELSGIIPDIDELGRGGRHLVAILSRERLVSVLGYMLDPDEFLSDNGIRSLSKVHGPEPYRFEIEGATLTIGYEPGESSSGVFGGNSNWRGPVWFPMNYLLIGALRDHHRYYGDDLRVEFPTGSGVTATLAEVADSLEERLVGLFRRGATGRRAMPPAFATENWGDLLWFHEYFHGDTGRGLGAEHQTGWTGLIADMLDRVGRRRGATTPDGEERA